MTSQKLNLIVYYCSLQQDVFVKHLNHLKVLSNHKHTYVK